MNYSLERRKKARQRGWDKAKKQKDKWQEAEKIRRAKRSRSRKVKKVAVLPGVSGRGKGTWVAAKPSGRAQQRLEARPAPGAGHHPCDHTLLIAPCRPQGAWWSARQHPPPFTGASVKMTLFLYFLREENKRLTVITWPLGFGARPLPPKVPHHQHLGQRLLCEVPLLVLEVKSLLPASALLCLHERHCAHTLPQYSPMNSADRPPSQPRGLWLMTPFSQRWLIKICLRR